MKLSSTLLSGLWFRNSFINQHDNITLHLCFEISPEGRWNTVIKGMVFFLWPRVWFFPFFFHVFDMGNSHQDFTMQHVFFKIFITDITMAMEIFLTEISVASLGILSALKNITGSFFSLGSGSCVSFQFGLVSLFNGISIFVGYWMPKLSS